jgi:hypothetical protein
MNNYLVVFLGVVCFTITLYHAGQLHLYIYVMAQGEFQAIWSGFFTILSPWLQFVLLFCGFSLQITTINTLLVFCPSVQNFMFQHYSEDILKQRGYNAPTSTLQRVATICAMCGLGLFGGEVSNRGAYIDELTTYKDTYTIYADTCEKSSVTVQPPTIP